MFPALQRPPPGRRRPFTSVLILMAVLVSSLTVAYDMTFENGGYDSIHFRELEERGEIHFDTRPLELERRQVGQDSSSISSSSATSISATAPTASTTSISSSSSLTSSATTSTGLTTAPSATVITTPLPLPFDTSLGNNFTSASCPAFFTNFLSNATFKACSPISLLLQNSASFFRAQRTPSLLAETLDTACAAPISVCTPLMTSLAQQLMSDNNCGADFRDQQPLVLQAYNGLVAYEPIYRATCLKDTSSSTNEYCYASAVSNTSNPGDAYPYYTAIGINLPKTAQPTCNQCLKSTMQIFAGYAVRKEQPLSQTYLDCAEQIDGGCGTGFADTTVKVGSVDSGMGQQASSMKNAATREYRSSHIVVVGFSVVAGLLAVL